MQYFKLFQMLVWLLRLLIVGIGLAGIVYRILYLKKAIRMQTKTSECMTWRKH